SEYRSLSEKNACLVPWRRRSDPASSRIRIQDDATSTHQSARLHRTFRRCHASLFPITTVCAASSPPSTYFELLPVHKRSDLKQAMGGGKTHLLVGFGLLAKHPSLRKTYCAGMPHASAFKSANIAAFNGRNNPDHFFWGEIANQLEKADQFKTFWTSGPKAPDEKDWLKLFEGSNPILVLLDEMPPYFHYLDTQKVGNGKVADIATRAFANLLTAAGKKKNICVVVSDLAAAYDTGARLINRALEDA